MPRLTIAVDITASASTPGTRKSTGLASVVFTESTSVKNTRTPSGITSVTSRLSLRRTVSSSSILVCAVSARTLTPLPSPVSRRKTSSSDCVPAPELAQEHALRRGATPASAATIVGVAGDSIT